MPSATALSRMSDQGLDSLLENAATISITGLDFMTADETLDFKFEPTVNLDALLARLIAERGVTGTLEALKVDGDEAGAFKLIWDHLDDNYSYYNTVVNDAFIDLGIAYANYLQAGGEPLYDIAKFSPDSLSDADSIPERSQSLHDNLLGNLHELSIADKFGGGAGEILDRIDDAGLGALIGIRGDYSDGRPIYGGYDMQDPAPTIAFDADFFFI